MKITFEFDTSSEDFNSSELERIKNADKMAHALYEIANKVRSWINYDEREYISKEEVSDSIWGIIKDDNLDINELYKRRSKYESTSSLRRKSDSM